MCDDWMVRRYYGARMRLCTQPCYSVEMAVMLMMPVLVLFVGELLL